ncbi:2-dehydro-3-deoxygalactonokinase [Roseibium salinum]|nr:2-dehydro-3-deoxygalactonokinase [Roseibium salinum]
MGGTSNLRIWGLDPAGNAVAHRISDKGMGALSRDEFEPALLELIGDLLESDGTTPIIICGMAGARQGWLEVPYISAPCAPPGIAEATAVHAQDPRLDVRILPGIMQSDPADVMRGEETQIAGFLAENPGHTGTLCLPGTHTKWVALRGGRVERFRTCMTGETFALLAKHSVLRHGLSADDVDQDAFRKAVTEMAAAPQALAVELFGIRAAGLVAGLSPQAAAGRLSGLLIGAELAAVRDEFDFAEVCLLGSDRIAKAYQAALDCHGCKARLLDADTITLSGLALAYSHLSVSSHSGARS